MTAASDGIPLGFGASNRATTTRFRDVLRRPRPSVLPGVSDAIDARLVEQAGFEACYLTGAGLANARFGVPDVGLTSMTDLVTAAQHIADATTLPLIVDGDTGFGGPLAVMRLVHHLEQVGAAGVQIEDQESPKRCGHFEDHTLITSSEMTAKISAAQAARGSQDFTIIARTDARSAVGLEEAINRANQYAAAGADVVFVEAPRSDAELREIARRVTGVPLVVNVVEGGHTPQLPLKTYAEYGYRIILYANTVLRVRLRAVQVALEHLRRHGDTEGLQMLSWKERQDLVQKAEIDRLADSFISPAQL